MARTIKFHLDEHVASAIADGLRRREIDVTTTPESHLISADDDAHLAYAPSQGRVIVTHDDGFLTRHSRGAPHAGNAFCHSNARSIGEMIRALELIWEILEPSEIANRVEFL
jgi:predicted nuclease of predicted toxin-antitoxin system